MEQFPKHTNSLNKDTGQANGCKYRDFLSAPHLVCSQRPVLSLKSKYFFKCEHKKVKGLRIIVATLILQMPK